MARYELGTYELQSKQSAISLLKALLCEFLGIFFINFFAVGACTQAPEQSAVVTISLAFGLVIFVAISIFGHISGGHINPAVTLALLVAGKINLIRSLLYIVVQCLGAIAGTATLKIVIPPESHNGLGHTSLHKGLTSLQGFTIEFFLGFILLFTVCGNVDPNKPDSRFLAAFAIGIAVTVGHLGTVTYTGSSMNPARTLGTAVMTGIWDNHWVYWVGPILGGIFAALIYTYLLKINEIRSEDATLNKP